MAESVAKKELSLTLKFNADTEQGRRALEQLAASATKVEQAASKASKALSEMSQRERNVRSGAYIEGIREDARLSAMERSERLRDKYGRVGGAVVGAGQDALAFAGRAAGAVAAAGVVTQAAANLTAAYQAQSNTMLTTRERTLAFAQAIPIVGSALSNLIDTSIDAIDRIRDPETAMRVDRARIENPIIMAKSAAQHDYDMRAMGLRREARESEYGLFATRANPSIALQAEAFGAALPTPMGMLVRGLFSEDNPISGAFEQLQSARRGVDAARRAAGASDVDATAAQAAMRRAVSQFKATSAAMDAQGRAAGIGGGAGAGGGTGSAIARAALWSPIGYAYDKLAGKGTDFANLGFRAMGGDPAAAGGMDGSRFRLEDAHQTQTRAALQAAQANAAAEAAVTANKERQLELARRQHELSKAETNLTRTKLSLIDSERETVRGAGMSFVGMDEISQMALTGALRRFKEGGRRAVSAEEIGLLQSNPLSARYVNTRLEQDAGGNLEFQDLLKQVGQRDLATIETERAKVKAELVMKVQLDEEQFQKVLTEKLKQLNLKDLLGEIVKNQLEIKLKSADADAIRARVERGGG